MSHPAAESQPGYLIGEISGNPGGQTRHDFGADVMINHAVQTVKEAKRISDLRRAEKIMGNAGILAAREARSYEVEINGWQGNLMNIPKATTDKVVEGDEGIMYANYELSQLAELPHRYQILANLAENYELR